MKILHLISTLDFGGAPRGVLELMSALSRRGGVDQRLVVLGEDTRTYPARDLPERAPRYLNYRLRHSDWMGIQGVARQIRESLQTEQVDVLHTHLLNADLIGALACRGTRCRHLSHVRGTSDWLTSPSWRDRLRRSFYRRTFLRAGTRFVAVSQAAAEHTRLGLRIPTSHIRVVVNGIDPARFPNSEPSRPFDGLVRVGSAGRFASEKGYGDLISAVGLLRARCPQLRLVLAGQGGRRAEYQAAIARLGLQGTCRLIPPVEEMNAFLRGLDIVALPSHSSEGLARVLMEAMYCERPVIAARVSGSQEAIVDQRTGLLFDPGDVQGLARQLERLVDSPAERERLGRAAGQFAAREFTVERVAAQVDAIYREMVAAGPRAS